MILGTAFAASPRLECYADEKNIRQGFLEARAVLNVPQRVPNWYDIIIYYKRPKVHTRGEIIAVDLHNFQRLQRFTDEALINLFRQASQ